MTTKMTRRDALKAIGVASVFPLLAVEKLAAEPFEFNTKLKPRGFLVQRQCDKEEWRDESGKIICSRRWTEFYLLQACSMGEAVSKIAFRCDPKEQAVRDAASVPSIIAESTIVVQGTWVICPVEGCMKNGGTQCLIEFYPKHLFNGVFGKGWDYDRFFMQTERSDDGYAAAYMQMKKDFPGVESKTSMPRGLYYDLTWK